MYHSYGTVEWLEDQFRDVEDDPWGLSWRGFEAIRYKIALRVLNDNIPKLCRCREELKILDLGCSTGFFTHQLRGLGGSVTGIDASETAIRRARRQYNDITFEVGSIFNPSIQAGNYDIITCLEAIYYVDQAAQPAFLSAIERRLSKNGVFLVSSKVGPPPYFSEERLMELGKKYFDLRETHHYGCAAFAAPGAVLFDLWRKMCKLQKLLGTENHMEETELLNLIVSSPDRQKKLRKLKTAAAKSRVLSFLMKWVVRLFLTMTQTCLRWKLPSRFANRLAQGLCLPSTHTILLLAKRNSAGQCGDTGEGELTTKT